MDSRTDAKMHKPLPGAPDIRHVKDSSAEKKVFSLTHVATFLILFSLWIILSGKFDLFHLSLGLISCVLVTCLSGDFLFPEAPRRRGALIWIRFLGYVPWLIYQITLANIYVLYLTFHPRMLDILDPQIFTFKSSLKSDLSLVTFANSITLTPGTITVTVSKDGDFRVHAIDNKSMEGFPGEMEARIARAFDEET